MHLIFNFRIKRKLKQVFNKQAMENKSFFIILSSVVFSLVITSASAQLREDFYKRTCPNVESLVRSAVTKKFTQTFVTAPATLRLFFHDCFVRVITSEPINYLNHINFLMMVNG